ncbi:MAG: sulfotransferase [Candidatus Thiodiazotropha sp.]
MANAVEENREAGFDMRQAIEGSDFIKAESLVSQALQTASADSQWLYAAMAEIRNGQQDYDAAQEFAEHALELDPELTEGRFQLACALLGKHALDQAGALFSELESSYADDARFCAQMARFHLWIYDRAKASAYAEKACRAKPDNSEYHALKAELLLIDRKFAEAATIARRAIKLNKRNAQAWRMLIRSILASSKKGESDKALRKIGKTIPLPHILETELAEWYITQRRFPEAEKRLREIVSQHPDYAPAYQAFVNLYFKTEQWPKAVEYGYKALGFDPYSLSVWRKIGLALAKNDEEHLAMGWLHKALLADPEDMLVGTMYANALHKMREYEAAYDLFRQILAQKPDSPQVMHLYAVLLMDMERNEEAIEVITRARELASDDYNIQMNLATAYVYAGKFTEAREIYKRIMQRKPEFSEAFLYYSEITPMAEDNELADVIVQHEQHTSDVKQKEEYNFALAKIFEDKQDYHRSFQHLSRACSLHKQRYGYNEAANLQGIQLIKSIFKEDFMRRFEGCGNASTQPYFVLGMPRSGTTLVEQILSSHPDVVGGGELTVMDSIVRDHAAMMDMPMVHSLEKITCDQIADLALEYLQMTASMGAADKHLVNKLPHNFLYIGLIALMFPNAKIICLKRNPMAICFSCYKKRFVKGHDYSFDLKDLGRYYLAYEDLMRHWYRLLPGRIYTADYEKLTGDFESETRKLIDYCGLEWNDACLTFHKNKRAVRTASQAQVRNPIYRKAVAFWQHFETELKPLSDIIMSGEAEIPR